MKKYYLVTGGNGYIGQNLYWKNWVSELGVEVDFTICDKDTVIPPAQDLKKTHLESFHGVIHFAALSGIFACEEDQAQAAVDNILAAGNVFRLATEWDIPVVFTSSQAAKDPHSSVYATMKWACERIADYYNREGGNIYVTRLANVYGGDHYLEKKRTCIRQFVTQYNENKPLEVHGNGEQIRDFIHVYDVCEAIYRIITKRPNYFNPIDIGTGKGTSILDVANMFPRKKNQHYSMVDNRSAGAESSIADFSVLEKLVGFRPMRKLEDYIKEMI